MADRAHDKAHFQDTGPFNVNNNVFIVDDNRLDLATSNVNYSENIEGSEADNIVDSNGKLTQAYSDYIGTRGWQLSDGLIPLELGTTPRAKSRGVKWRR